MKLRILLVSLILVVTPFLLQPRAEVVRINPDYIGSPIAYSNGDSLYSGVAAAVETIRVNGADKAILTFPFLAVTDTCIFTIGASSDGVIYEEIWRDSLYAADASYQVIIEHMDLYNRIALAFTKAGVDTTVIGLRTWKFSEEQ